MRPARMLSRWVKLRPWYYTARRQPTRARSIEDDMLAEVMAREALECVGCFRVRRDGDACPRCGEVEADVVNVGDVDERQWVEACGL